MGWDLEKALDLALDWAAALEGMLVSTLAETWAPPKEVAWAAKLGQGLESDSVAASV
jgi:hypothetical protein